MAKKPLFVPISPPRETLLAISVRPERRSDVVACLISTTALRRSGSRLYYVPGKIILDEKKGFKVCPTFPRVHTFLGWLLLPEGSSDMSILAYIRSLPNPNNPKVYRELSATLGAREVVSSSVMSAETMEYLGIGVNPSIITL
jgi:hypothetical protein